MNRTYCVCSKCGKDKPQEKHHFLPQCHFGKGAKNPHTISLCGECHEQIDDIILLVESIFGGVKLGQRFMLTKHEYEKIHKYWLRKSKVINLQFA
jgi:hypothetical protein